MHRTSFFLAIFQIIFLWLPATQTWAADPPPMGDNAIVLDSIEVGPTYEIANLSNLAKAQSKYDTLSPAIREVIDLRFYLIDRNSQRIIIGPALEKIHLQLVTPDKESRSLSIAKNGMIDVSVNGEKARSHIEANIPKGRADVDFRLSIKLPRDKPLTLGFLRASADAFQEAHKLYAGMIFRMFIGDHKPNCFGMGFFTSQSVQAFSVNSQTPLWTSSPGTRVVVFFDDIPTKDPDTIISWTGDTEPYLTAACLMNRESSH
jgi:hypothetical protein